MKYLATNLRCEKKEESRKLLTYGTFSEALQDGLALGFAAFEAVRRKNHDPGRWEEPPEHKKFSTGVEDFALSICI